MFGRKTKKTRYLHAEVKGFGQVILTRDLPLDSNLEEVFDDRWTKWFPRPDAPGNWLRAASPWANGPSHILIRQADVTAVWFVDR